MRKELIKVILRFIILVSLFGCWLAIILYSDAIYQGLGNVSVSIRNVAIYYVEKWWWTYPLTALAVNMTSLFFAKLIPIKSKIVAKYYWALSGIMTILFLAPYVLGMYMFLVMGE